MEKNYPQLFVFINERHLKKILFNKEVEKNISGEIEPLIIEKIKTLYLKIEDNLLNNDKFREDEELYYSKSIIIKRADDSSIFLEKDKFNNLVIAQVDYKASIESDILPIRDSLLKSQFINEVKKIISEFIEQPT